MVKISVVVPIYNVGDYLSRCLDALCNQTLEDIEIICVEDCSTDNSYEILQEYIKKDNRIKLIPLEINSGAAVARNKGLEIATGEYLGFVDPDDSIDLNYYEELYKKAKESDCDIVKCRRKTINLDQTVTESNLNEIIQKQGCYFFTYEWQTAIYKHSLIKKYCIKFPEECRKAQDTVFLNRFVLHSKNIELIDNVYYYYYKRENSLNAAKIPIENIISALKSAEIQLQDLNESDLYYKDESVYISLYWLRINSVLVSTLFQNDSYEARSLCANWIIQNYYKCLNIRLLSNEFTFTSLLPLIKRKKYKKLTKKLANIRSMLDFYEVTLGLILKTLWILFRYRKKKIVFWGASIFIEEFINKFKLNYRNILGIIDKNPLKIGRKIGNYTIYSQEYLEILNPDFVLLTVFSNNKKIYNSLESFLKEQYPQIELLPNIFD